MAYFRAMLAAGLLFSGFFLCRMGGAAADDYSLAGLHVLRPWARASTGSTGAVYLTIENHGERPDALLSASSPVAKKVQLHVTTQDGGVMKMRPIDALEIAPAAKVTLEPGHYHLMLFDIGEPLRAGSSFPLVLKFRNAGELPITVSVDAANSRGPMSGQVPDTPSSKQETGQ
jgi:copper(I)-binding protein